MTFYSLSFFFFLIIVFAVYYTIPKRYRYIWLVIASLFFYATHAFAYLYIILGVTMVSYIAAYFINSGVKSRLVLILSLMLLIGLLLFLRVQHIMPGGEIKLNISAIGVSFYTLVAIGYVVDVYLGRTDCEKNFLKYLLFVSFFPLVLSGPVERSGNLLAQIRKGTEFSYEKTKKGILMILFGLYLKCLIADRMAIIVNSLFDSYSEQTGAAIFFGIILYGFQLYADFSGYSYIAIGVSLTLGFEVADNFRQPYLAKSIREFWGRWHISLSSWLKDYIYIPLGGNRKGIKRQYINLIVTFVISGIWHGSGANFLLWGIIHGVYQVACNLVSSLRKTAKNRIKINRDCFSYHFVQVIITFALVDFAWIFFRAPSINDAFNIFSIIIKNFQLGNTIENRLWLAGYDYERFVLLALEFMVWMFIDIALEKEIGIIKWLDNQNRFFRWMIYIVGCAVVIIGMLYNNGSDVSDFVYTRF